MKYSWAVPGRKVVCVLGGIIDARPRVLRLSPTPVQGEVYTITHIKHDDPEYGGLRLILKERPNLDSKGRDHGWGIIRFRPLHTVETDVALFAGLLTPAPNAPMLPTKEYTTT